jgi:hypothetical protein
LHTRGVHVIIEANGARFGIGLILKRRVDSRKRNSTPTIRWNIQHVIIDNVVESALASIKYRLRNVCKVITGKRDGLVKQHVSAAISAGGICSRRKADATWARGVQESLIYLVGTIVIDDIGFVPIYALGDWIRYTADAGINVSTRDIPKSRMVIIYVDKPVGTS